MNFGGIRSGIRMSGVRMIRVGLAAIVALVALAAAGFPAQAQVYGQARYTDASPDISRSMVRTSDVRPTEKNARKLKLSLK